MELLCLVPLFFVVWFILAHTESETIDNSPNEPNRNGYAAYRQMHGYGVNPNPTDMHTNVNANLYNFPNGPNSPNH